MWSRRNSTVIVFRRRLPLGLIVLLGGEGDPVVAHHCAPPVAARRRGRVGHWNAVYAERPPSGGSHVRRRGVMVVADRRHLFLEQLMGPEAISRGFVIRL